MTRAWLSSALALLATTTVALTFPVWTRLRRRPPGRARSALRRRAAGARRGPEAHRPARRGHARPAAPLERDRNRRERARSHAGEAGRDARVRRAARARPREPRDGDRPHRDLR